jgi:hypothetical protein
MPEKGRGTDILFRTPRKRPQQHQTAPTLLTLNCAHIETGGSKLDTADWYY